MISLCYKFVYVVKTEIFVSAYKNDLMSYGQEFREQMQSFAQTVASGKAV